MYNSRGAVPMVSECDIERRVGNIILLGTYLYVVYFARRYAVGIHLTVDVFSVPARRAITRRSIF